MKILVTGGAGFIGRHLASLLLKSNDHVTIFDNFSNSNNEQIDDLIKNGALLVKGDVTDYNRLIETCSQGFDAVVHLAAKIGVNYSLEFPEETFFNNVTGTLRLLRACVKEKIKNVVAASSVAVYGNTKVLPLTENIPTIPISPYGASKICLEHCLQAFANSYDLNCISLRFSNVYGEGQTNEYAGVITKFINNIENGKPLVIYGDGTNTRDFVSADDVCISIKNSLERIDEKKGTPYNIASGTHSSINDLAKIMLDISGKSLKIIHDKPLIGDIKHSYASIDLARQELGYQPKIQLQDGLLKLLKEK